ncbi:MAG: hypothetical protein WDM89_02340 [Rhizomicrobium sp.]
MRNLFVRAAIARLLDTEAKMPRTTARLTHSIRANDAREDYLRTKLIQHDGDYWADIFETQDSSMLSTLAAADGLVVRKPGAPALNGGEAVDVLLLERPLTGPTFCALTDSEN